MDTSVRRFGKRSMREINNLDDERFREYIRKGDDPELHRLDDLEALVQAFLVRKGTNRPESVSPKNTQKPVQKAPRGLDVCPR